MVFYGNFYQELGLFDVLVWLGLTVPLVLTADRTNVFHSKINVLATAFFMIPLLIQEIVGHTFFEESNSRLTLSYVINSILYTPLFYTRCIQGYLSYVLGHWVSGVAIIGFGCYISYLFVKKRFFTGEAANDFKQKTSPEEEEDECEVQKIR